MDIQLEQVTDNSTAYWHAFGNARCGEQIRFVLAEGNTAEEARWNWVFACEDLSGNTDT